jgi:hypothetical protein
MLDARHHREFQDFRSRIFAANPVHGRPPKIINLTLATTKNNKSDYLRQLREFAELGVGMDKRQRSRFKKLVSEARKRSKEKGTLFELTLETVCDQWQKQRGICALTGLQMTCVGRKRMKFGDYDYRQVSIDRTDSKKGYAPSNIQLVCAWINRVKWDAPEEWFIEMCCRVARYRGSSDKVTLQIKFTKDGTREYELVTV